MYLIMNTCLTSLAAPHGLLFQERCEEKNKMRGRDSQHHIVNAALPVSSLVNES